MHAHDMTGEYITFVCSRGVCTIIIRMYTHTVKPQKYEHFKPNFVCYNGMCRVIYICKLKTSLCMMLNQDTHQSSDSLHNI